MVAMNCLRVDFLDHIKTSIPTPKTIALYFVIQAREKQKVEEDERKEITAMTGVLTRAKGERR